MTTPVLVSNMDYLLLRREARETLHRFGIPSNPGFSDTDILTRLTTVIGTHIDIVPVSHEEYSEELFRDNLCEVLALDPPTAVDSIAYQLSRL
jgi:hypothetical protein